MLQACGEMPPARRTVRAMTIYALGEHVPLIHPDAFVHPDAVIIGDVQIGAESTVWPGAVLRGDGGGQIRVGSRTSIQDGAVIHTTAEQPTIVGWRGGRRRRPAGPRPATPSTRHRSAHRR